MSEATDMIPGPDLHRRLLWKRRIFWLVLVIYLPMMLVSQQLFPGRQGLVAAFVAWLVLLVASALVLALTRCPACGKTFHMNGMSFLPVRRCLHCGVHVSARPEESP